MNENKGYHCYDDIINLPKPTSLVHPRMSLHDRAAQFSPFAALTGHDAAIRETERITDKKMEPSEDIKTKLNIKLQIVQDNLGTDIPISITYFVPDETKEGGKYISCSGTVKRIDIHEATIVMTDKTVIPIEHIIEIESELFRKWENTL